MNKDRAVELAQQVGLVKRMNVTDEYRDLLHLYSQAVIAEYKAGLVPVAWHCAGEAYSLKAEADLMEIELGYKIYPLYALKESEND